MNMNTLMVLIKANFTSLATVRRLYNSKTAKQKLRTFSITTGIALISIMLVSNMFFYSFAMADALAKIDALEALISIAVIGATLICLFMSLYMAPSYLFAFKDYDLLMSLPIKHSVILANKLFFLYVQELLAALLIALPPLVTYGIRTDCGVLYYVYAIAAVLFIPFIPLAAGGILSFITGRISSRFKSSSAFMLICTFALIILIMAGSFSLNTVSAAQAQNIIFIFDLISRYYVPLAFFTKALAGQKSLFLLAFILTNIVVLAVFAIVFSKSFKSINEKMSERYKITNFKLPALKTASPAKALFTKELRGYFSSYIYAVNTFFGMVMMTVLAFGLPVFGPDKIMKLFPASEAAAYILPIITLAFAFCIVMTNTTAPSVSLEGKSLWILKSSPVDVLTVFRSKISVNLVLIIPLLVINSIVCAMTLHMNPVQYLVFLSTSLMYAFYTALSGLLINLYFPKMDWATQVIVVKQSMSVIIAVLAGIGTVAIPAVLSVILKPASFITFLLVVAAVLALINLSLWSVLKTRGIKLYNEL
jgi:ABC-2 type transport system permease protein